MNYTESTQFIFPSENITNYKAEAPLIERVIRWFEKDGDELVGEMILDSVKLEDLQHLFGVTSENPMYECYPIETTEQINYFQKILKYQLQLQSYEYFLDCDAIPIK